MSEKIDERWEKIDNESRATRKNLRLVKGIKL